MQLTIPVESETLAADEVTNITGRTQRAQQIAWLKEKAWHHEINAAGVPIIGRLYARFKLAGVDLAAIAPAAGLAPDFAKVR